ncbi:MAG: hypothetical protein RQ760_15235, partial [Sedimentisphaerales bacterium]|nr:hypothetical protein [Sedimentisphaerales bacterium]
MFPKKYNPHAAHSLITGLLLLILSAWSDAALPAWQPPIGIPAPSFGINENVDMYIGQQYTFTDGRGTINYPISSVSGNPYTHYVDKNNSNATDTNNPYGTESTPRLTIPTTLTEGSVVEIHGGPYTYGSRIWTWTSQGTAQKPVFIRGWDAINVANFP